MALSYASILGKLKISFYMNLESNVLRKDSLEIITIF